MSEVLVPVAPSDHLDWFRNGVCYQVFPDRFARVDDGRSWELDPWNATPTRTNFMGGNLAGITSKLDYLAQLGVASLYSTPIFDAPANHRYDTRDYLALAPMLGDEADLRRLIDEAGARGIGLILDGVFNHCGNTMPMFERALAGDVAARSWYHFHPETNDYQTVGDYPMMPKLHHRNEDVFQYFLSVLRRWDDFGIAGWRMDVPWKAPAAFWTRLRAESRDLHASQLWIAEAWAQWGFASSNFDSVMNYHARNRLLDLVHLHHADAEDYFLDLADWSATRTDPSVILNVVGSHDTARIRTMCGGNVRSTRMLLAMHLLMPGVPMLYYGDEIGLEGENDPGCRATFPTHLDTEQTEFADAIAVLTRMRGTHRALTHGDLRLESLRNRAFVVSRNHGSCSIRIAGNMSDHAEPLAVDARGPWTSVWGPAPAASHGLTLAPRSLALQVTRCGCVDEALVDARMS